MFTLFHHCCSTFNSSITAVSLFTLFSITVVPFSHSLPTCSATFPLSSVTAVPFSQLSSITAVPISYSLPQLLFQFHTLFHNCCSTHHTHSPWLLLLFTPFSHIFFRGGRGGLWVCVGRRGRDPCSQVYTLFQRHLFHKVCVQRLLLSWPSCHTHKHHARGSSSTFSRLFPPDAAFTLFPWQTPALRLRLRWLLALPLAPVRLPLRSPRGVPAQVPPVPVPPPLRCLPGGSLAVASCTVVVAVAGAISEHKNKIMTNKRKSPH